MVAGVALGCASLDWPKVVASSDRSVYFLPLARPLGQIALLLTVSGAFVLVQRVRDATRAAVFLGAGWCLAWLLLIRAAALVAPIYSGVALAAAIPADQRDVPVYSVGTYDQSLTFYLQRTVTLVGYRGELDYGLRKAPDAEIADLAEFLRRWSAQSRAFAVMEKTMFDDLEKPRGADAAGCHRRQSRPGGAAMSWITWALILMGVGLNAAAQLLLKVATRPLAHFSDFSADTLGSSVGILFKSPSFWAGMVCYAASVCVWLAALSKAPVSTAYPMLSLGYVVVAAVSVLWLGESMGPAKVLGIALICAGVILVSRSSA